MEEDKEDDELNKRHGKLDTRLYPGKLGAATDGVSQVSTKHMMSGFISSVTTSISSCLGEIEQIF